MNILYIDTETTGLHPSENSIIEIAAILEIDGKKIDTFETKLAPKNTATISLSALKINKNSLTSAINGPDRSSKLRLFVDWLLSLKVSGPLYICGHNVNFDINFIKDALKNELNVMDWESAVSYRVLDTSTIGTFLIESGVLKIPDNMPKGSSLEKLALALGIEIRGRKLHSAMEDVKLTAEVFKKLKELAGKINVQS